MVERKAAPLAPSQRQLRVGEEIRRVVARAFERGELNDPVLYDARVTVSEVTVSPDLRNATVWIMPLGGGEAPELMEALKRAAGRISGLAARQVRLKYAPRLTFKRDSAFDVSGRIDVLLKDPLVQRDLDAGEAGPDEPEATDGSA